MKEYEVEIKEILSKSSKVIAISQEEAIQMVKKKYRNEEIILSADDHVDTEYGVLNEVQIVFDEKINYINKGNSPITLISDIEENKFYAYDISGEGYADLWIIKKERDTLWSAFVLSDHYGTMPQERDITDFFVEDEQYCFYKFKDVSYLSADVFPQVARDMYEAEMDTKVASNNLIHVVNTDIPIEAMTAKKLHDLHKESTSKDKAKNNELER